MVFSNHSCHICYLGEIKTSPKSTVLNLSPFMVAVVSDRHDVISYMVSTDGE